MGIHNRWQVVVAGAAVAGEVESITGRPERQQLFALGQRFKQVILRLVGGALTATLKAEHAFELAFTEVPQRAAHAQMNVEGATVWAEWICRPVFCGHGDTSPVYWRNVAVKDGLMGSEGVTRVYHFCDAKYGLQNLQRRRLKVATIMELNDPFELVAHNMKDSKIRNAVKKFKANSAARFGFLCFSRSYKSPVQWGHYAEKHKGICIGFDVPTEELYSVNYTDYRLNFEPSMVDTDEKKFRWLMGFFTTKHSHWSYEQEERMIVSLPLLEREADFYFAFFDKADIRVAEVMVGCNSKITRQDVLDALGEHSENVEIFKARPAFGEFEIVRNRNAKLWT